MTAKEKAKELFDKYATYAVMWSGGIEVERQNCKHCALIAVEEIYNGGLHLRYGAYLDEFEDKQNYYSYWEEVKQELEKL